MPYSIVIAAVSTVVLSGIGAAAWLMMGRVHERRWLSALLERSAAPEIAKTERSVTLCVPSKEDRKVFQKAASGMLALCGRSLFLAQNRPKKEVRIDLGGLEDLDIFEARLEKGEPTQALRIRYRDQHSRKSAALITPDLEAWRKAISKASRN